MKNTLLRPDAILCPRPPASALQTKTEVSRRVEGREAGWGASGGRG
jgi:hypothetical protein